MRWCLVILLFAPAWCAAQPLTFKGLTLGMSRAQVDSLLRVTRWCDVYTNWDSDALHKNTFDPGNTDLAACGYGPSGRLGSQAHLDSRRRRARDTFSLWACEGGQCFGFDQVWVIFSGNDDTSHLEQLGVFSSPFDTNQVADANAYVRAAVATLVDVYGKPSKVVARSTPITKEKMIALEFWQRLDVAEWTWARKGKPLGVLSRKVSVGIVRDRYYPAVVQVVVGMDE